jgi:PucR C-terminal helix-turn-helix domain/GGDEF-like domain
MTTRPPALVMSPGHDEVLAGVAAGASKDSGVPADLLGGFLVEATMAIARGRRLSAPRVATYSRHGADAAARSVELAALIDLYLSAAWRLWREIPALLPGLPAGAQAVVAAGQGMLRTSDDVVAAVAAGYQQARETLLLQTASARRDFVDDLFGNVGGPGELRDRAEAFGLRLAASHAVAVLELTDQRIDESHVLVSRAAAICRAFPDPITSLVTSKDGALVVVVAGPAPADDLAALAGRLRVDEAALRAGVGRPWAGDNGPMRSYREALDCLTVAARIGLVEAVARADDLLVHLVLWRDRPVLVDLVRSALLPLAGLRGGAADQLVTLRAYFEHRGVATATARALHLSVRGLTYRIERIRRVLPHDLDDARQRLTIELALTAAQLLDWPAQPLLDHDS